MRITGHEAFQAATLRQTRGKQVLYKLIRALHSLRHLKIGQFNSKSVMLMILESLDPSFMMDFALTFCEDDYPVNL